MHPANERRCYIVTTSPIVRMHTWTDPWVIYVNSLWSPSTITAGRLSYSHSSSKNTDIELVLQKALILWWRWNHAEASRQIIWLDQLWPIHYSMVNLCPNTYRRNPIAPTWMQDVSVFHKFIIWYTKNLKHVLLQFCNSSIAAYLSRLHCWHPQSYNYPNASETDSNIMSECHNVHKSCDYIKNELIASWC